MDGHNRMHLLTLALAFALVGCSDDSGKPLDGSADKGSPDQSVSDMAKGTEGGAPDMATVDTGTVDQQVTTPDAATPPIVTSSHTGWKQKDCSKCHTLPVKGHTTSDTAECATCHGGNGACTPPTTHVKTATCTSSGCHGNKHSYTQAASCVSCHFAAAGTAKCP